MIHLEVKTTQKITEPVRCEVCGEMAKERVEIGDVRYDHGEIYDLCGSEDCLDYKREQLFEVRQERWAHRAEERREN